MANSLQDLKDEAMRKKMGKAYDEAPYLSMGTKPPKRPRLLEPVRPDEFQRGVEAGPEPRPMPKVATLPPEMIPTPEQERKMKQQVMDGKMKRRMGEAYDQAAPESMKGYAKGGSVGSASKRADGCAQRGKTKGRMI